MKSFFKSLFACFIGTLAAFFIMSSIGMVFLIGLLSFSDTEPTPITTQSFMKINLNGTLVDRTDPDPLSAIMGDYSEKKTGLDVILNAIEKATTNDYIKGIYLTTDGVSLPLASAEEIRTKLLQFKESGKFVVAYADSYSQSFYYLSTAANKVYLNPMGNVWLSGLSFSVPYMRGALDKLGVEMQIFKVGTFKSAVEPYTLSKMSQENHLQLSELGASSWGYMVHNMASARKINATNIDKLIEQGIYMEEGALYVKEGLVDSLLYRTDMIEVLKQQMSVDKEDQLSMVEYESMAAQPAAKNKSKDKIAVYYAEGEITENAPEGITSKQMVQDLYEIRNDSSVKALVLRVNSPGGSGYASEQIWYEVERIRQRIPVIVSMGDMAASGGYYISCNATKIVAQPTTLTGSIGVFGMIPSFEELSKKVGVTIESVGTHRVGNPIVLSRDMRPEEKAIVQKSINNFYSHFITRCAEGRKMPKEKIEAVAQGRVWTGIKAKELGLVDELGGLDEAIAIAAKEANLTSYQHENHPAPKSMFEQVQSMLNNTMASSIVSVIKGEPIEKLVTQHYLKHWNIIQARMLPLQK